jgi:membrane-bound lytic murein transglycosylase B
MRLLLSGKMPSLTTFDIVDCARAGGQENIHRLAGVMLRTKYFDDDCTMKAMTLLLLALASPVLADENVDFRIWKQELHGLAFARGISERTVMQATASMELLPRVIELDARQPEFTQTFLQYLSIRVSERTVNQGTLMLEKQRPLLESLKERYGVDAGALLALWGLETAYGQQMGNIELVSALATLAFQGRRQDFFTEQLLILLSLMDSGRYQTDTLQGSWAGAFGHMQFIPSTLHAYGVDADNDGIIDLRNSLADAMASAANYLSQAGWKEGEPIALEISLPAGFDFGSAQLSTRKTTEEWTALGVMPTAIEKFPPVSGPASILLPQGYTGPAFMVFDNFHVIMDWNKSANYALAVAQLSNRLNGLPELSVREARQHAINPPEISRLQALLLQAGFNPGKPDGIAGMQTQDAIRKYQLEHGMIADGYPSRSLLEHVLQNASRTE